MKVRLTGKPTILPMLMALPVFGEGFSELSYQVNNLWLLVATALVFVMHIGFATLEAGLTRAKNTVNILFKNVSVLSLGLLTYTLCGFSLMFPGFEAGAGEWFGFRGWGPGLGGAELVEPVRNVSPWSFFLFHGMFAATCATIVSGAVAERIKLVSFLVFSALFVAFVYPVLGSWTWGEGWLNDKGFHDFAGATLVHSVGGWAALAGAVVLGPRLGKYVNSSVKPIIGHNLPLSTVGVMLMWFGWYGFNGGSVMSADPDLVSRVFVMTSLSAATGLLSAMLCSWTLQRKPDLTMTMNGALAGLVGITAGADILPMKAAILIGFISGILVVFCISGFDKLRIDDPVGALSVHLVGGIWGTLAVGYFSETHTLGIQALGVVSYALGAFLPALALFWILKITAGLRVSEDEELGGLDIGEHGMEAYTGFQIFTTQ